MEAYCVKCRAKREMADANETTFETKHGKKKAMKGKCPNCGTGMYRILGNA